jgi:hypothetical protein
MYRCFPPWTIEHWLAGRTVLNLNRLEKEVWQYWPHSLRLIARELLGFATYFLGVWPICTIQVPKDFRGYPWPGRWLGKVMGLDTGAVFKRPVLCPHCNEDYLFTLRAIANNQELRCHGCGGSIRLSGRAYEPLLSDVRNTLDAIDCAQLVPSFSALPR